MIRLFTKLSLSAGAILGVYFLEINKENTTLVNQEAKEILPKIETISSIEDIEIFERNNGCAFAFTNPWGKKTSYKAREYLENIKYKNMFKSLEQNIIKVASSNKEKCKTEKIVPLIRKGKNFENTKENLIN